MYSGLLTSELAETRSNLVHPNSILIHLTGSELVLLKYIHFTAFYGLKVIDRARSGRADAFSKSYMAAERTSLCVKIVGFFCTDLGGFLPGAISEQITPM